MSCCTRRLLHDVGLATSLPQVDFTRTSARAAREVAEEVGLSTSATDAMRSAITLHHSPGVTRGAGLDVIGLRSWQLPRDVLEAVTSTYPRLEFKREFTAAFPGVKDAIRSNAR